MTIKTITLPSMSRVAPGSKALLEVPIGPTYQKIGFTVTGTALVIAHIGQIEVLVNGNAVRTHKDLQRLIDLNAYYNQSVDTAADFVLHFDRSEFHELADQLTPNFGTADLQTLSIEIQLPAGAPANITMSAWAMVDTQPQPLGVYTRIKETSLASPVSGDVDYDKLARGDKVYQAVHFFKPDITKVTLEVDQYKVKEATKAVLEREQKSVRDVARVPQTAKATHVDFNLNGSPSDLLKLKGAQDVRFKLNFGSIGTVDIVTEELSTEY